MTMNQRNNKPLSNTRQRDMAQHYVSRTHHNTTSNYATTHDNANNGVPRHNTHPNTAQHHSKQHNKPHLPMPLSMHTTWYLPCPWSKTT